MATEAVPPACHPANAWTAMAKGYSIDRIAAAYGDLPRKLDQAVWAWRAEMTGSTAPAGLSTMQALGLRNLAPHDPLAAERFRERA